MDSRGGSGFASAWRAADERDLGRPDSGVRVAVLRQAWRTVTFVHWRYPAAPLQTLPSRGLSVEEYGGSAWLTLTPLQMQDVRLPGMPAVPGLSRFAETNLRTNVRGPDGRRAYTRHADHLLAIPVRHEPWPLQTAAVTMLDESLTTAAGLPASADIALAHYSAGVTDVAFGMPRPTRTGPGSQVPDAPV